MAVLEVKNIKKTFGKTEVLKGIDFTLEKGEVLSIIGSSGSGKTTLLRCINFLEFAEEGTIWVDGKQIFDGSAEKKLSDAEIRQNRLHFGLVFQSFNLFPQYNVLENITLAPNLLKRGTAEENKALALKLIERVGLSDKVESYPCQLSGGQQQRVAIARALVKMPRVLLLDEPLSNLDARLRLQTREEIRRIQKETGITTVFVTHDQEEAMSISDIIVVMKLGILQQIGKPQEVYDDPHNLFVAKFLGTPPINVLEGKVHDGKVYIGEQAVLEIGGVENQDVYIGIRPEGIEPNDNGVFECKLNNIEVMGRDASVVSSHEASLNPVIRAIISSDIKVDPHAETVKFNIKPHKFFLFNKETEERIYFEVK